MFPRTLALTFLGACLTAAASDNTDRLNHSAEVFAEVMEIADKAIPQTLLDKSQCVIVVPGMKKGAFIFGAKYGRGFAVCRAQGGVGWGPPGAVRVEGGSFGLQIGGSETDVILLVMNERGAKRLLGTSKFTIGGDASAAAGPVGRTATAETDALLTAEILTWSRSRGLFAGVSLQGATMRQDLDVNKELYGGTIQNKDLVFSGRQPPASAAQLLKLLNKYSSRQSK
ncbi:MAG: lipid-binding SYLF domain-containing protein [Acidimicrobiia bacterium]|nr:lipid-binding SYLF domain-containing protein [Acidimicrobiia bacterium]